MSKVAAAALVFICSAAVLMLEILAGRLLAPYVGISLKTYTSIIGTVLAGIAVGAWGGGRLADRIDPRRLLGPTVALGGLLSLFTVPLVRSFGDQSSEGGRGATLFLAFTAFFLPAVVLSAVTPMVVKLQLHDLQRTGGVVGRLSGISTFGALVGTFVTGFLLVATTPTSTVIYAIGGTLIVVGLGLGLWLARRDSVVFVVIAVLGASAATVAAAGTSSPCQVESAYYCIRVEHDLARPSGRILWLDDLMHSYVDLSDPTFLEFDYVRSFSDAVAVAWPNHRALDALHVGGGGFTMPRYLAAEYPGTKSTVLEIDPSVLKTGRERLGLHTSDALRVRIGDARIGIRTRARLGGPRGRRRVRQPLGPVAPHDARVRRGHRPRAPTRRDLHRERDRLPVVPVRAGGARDVPPAVRLGRRDRPPGELRRPLWRQHRVGRIGPPSGRRRARAPRRRAWRRRARGSRARPLHRQHASDTSDDYAPIDQWLDDDKN